MKTPKQSFYLLNWWLDKQDGERIPCVQVLAPFAIGMAVYVAHVVAVPLDGCALNRTLFSRPCVCASGIITCKA